MEEEELRERIKQVMSFEAQSAKDFSEKIGVSSSTLSHVLSGRNNPSLDIVRRVHLSHPYINLNWLMYGKGDMLDGMVESGQQRLHFQNADAVETLHEKQLNTQLSAEDAAETPNKDTSIKQVSNPAEKLDVVMKNEPQKKIEEIRIFFSDNTFQIFKPQK